MFHNLTIDVGNTQTKVGFFKQDVLEKVFIYDQLIPDILVQQIKQLKIGHSILVNSGKYDSIIDETLSNHTNFIKLNHKTAAPIINKYATPQTLGKDRLCSAIGATTLQKNGHPLLIIDTGTCITFNMVSKYNEYLGGSIAPGIEMRLKALPHFTHLLPLIKYDYTAVNLIGTDTESSILSGIINGIIAEIDGLISRYRNNYDDLMVYMTGGGCNFFEKQLKNKIFASPYLVLIGLNKILTYNATT